MSSRTDVDRAEKERDVIRLRRSGLTQEEIGAELGISQATVHRYLKSGLDRVVAPEVENLRAESYERLSDLLPPQTRRAAKGDPAAAAVVVRIDESIRKLYGLNAPEHIGIALSQRTEEDGRIIADALSEALGGVLDVAVDDPRFRRELEQFGSSLAQWVLTERTTPRPIAPARPVQAAAESDEPGVQKAIADALRMANEILGQGSEGPK